MSKEQEKQEQEKVEQETKEDQEKQEKAEKLKSVDPERFQALQEEVERLRSHSEQLLAEKKKQQKEAKEAAEKAEAARREAAKKDGDVEALEKSWQKKLEEREQELRQEIEQHNQWVRDLTVGQTATALASEIAIQGSAKALLPHIRSRLGTDIRDGKPTTVILDEEGKPSAMTLEDLKKEFSNDPAFAPLIVGSKASGSGGTSGRSAGSAPSKPVKLSTDPSERREYFKQRFDLEE